MGSIIKSADDCAFYFGIDCCFQISFLITFMTVERRKERKSTTSNNNKVFTAFFFILFTGKLGRLLL